MAEPSASNADLSDEQKTDISTQFQQMLDVTSEVADEYLERCGYSLELAAQEYFNAEEGRPSNFAGAQAANHVEHVDAPDHYGAMADAYEHENDLNEGVRRRLLQRDAPSADDRRMQLNRPHRLGGAVQLSWPSWIWRILTLPVTFVWATWSSIVNMLFSIFFGPTTRGPGAIAGGADVSDSVTDVQSFIARFDETYPNVERVPFHMSSYKALMTTIRTDLRYAIVYIHSWIHEDSHEFCRHTLTSPRLRAFLERESILFWAVDAQSSLGGRVSQAMHESRYPSLSLLAMRDGRPALIVRMNGLEGNPRTADVAIVQLLQQALNDNAPFMHAARQLRDQRTADTLLRAEQQRAYEETMERDRQVQLERDAEQQRQVDEAEQANRERLAEEHRVERLGDFREYLQAKIDGASGGDEKKCRVGVSMPNGTRLTLQLNADDGLDTLYHNCVASPACPLAVSLWTAHPRTQLDYRPQWLVDVSWLDNDTPFDDVLRVDEVIPTIGGEKLSGQMIYVQDDDA